MAVYEYTEVDGYGFVGLRVAVTIDGHLRQKYLSFLKDNGCELNAREKRQLRAEAQALDRQWRALQALARSGRQPSDTGVKGISAQLVRDTRRLADGSISVSYRVVSPPRRPRGLS